jgi:Esterase-like activity of phytase
VRYVRSAARRSPALFATLIASVLTGCSAVHRRATVPGVPENITKLTLIGQASILPLGRYPPSMGLPFGGISALAKVSEQDVLGVSDGRFGGRVYRFRFENVAGALTVETIGIVPLEIPSGAIQSDQEGLAVLPNGDMLLAAEGTGREPRRPPTLTQYGRYGQFERNLPIPDRYIPEPTGPLTRGARGNASFESLTLSPDGKRLFTATETALVQDGSPATFDSGTNGRILEYIARHDTFEPGAEYVYPIESLDKPPFEPGAFINGLVDLLALSRTTLLALERSYVQNRANPQIGENRIRIYRVALAGATDVSNLESLKAQHGIVPVTKTLLLDLSQVPGLSPDLLAGRLDNFEGMSFGPHLPDGRATLVLVSDDNFNATQRTWFLVFSIGEPPR